VEGKRGGGHGKLWRIWCVCVRGRRDTRGAVLEGWATGMKRKEESLIEANQLMQLANSLALTACYSSFNFYARNSCTAARDG
jgi:hypothetical protein